jgi:N-acetylglucosamine-6-phosphate deacetylase
MCAPRPYRRGDVEVELLADQCVVLRGGERLAGSSLRMDHAISNVMKHVTPRQAIAMATCNPARVARIAERLRRLAPGERADVVGFRIEDGRIRVIATLLAGA